MCISIHDDYGGSFIRLERTPSRDTLLKSDGSLLTKNIETPETVASGAERNVEERPRGAL